MILKNLLVLFRALILIFEAALNIGFVSSHWKVSEVIIVYKG